MDNENQVIIDLKSKTTEETHKNKIIISNKKFYFFISMIFLVFLGIIYFIYINKKELTIKIQNNQIKNNLVLNETITKIINLENKINLLENKTDNLTKKFNESINPINNNKNTSTADLSEISFEKFDENILQQINSQQMEFCNNKNKYIKEEYEKHIKLVNVDFLGKKFDMYVYTNEDIVSISISSSKSWEAKDTKTLINILNYYSSLKNITRDNIYILDIGSNVGWYTLFLAKFGYKILAFEPSDVNMYMIRKSFCLNQDLNITLIKKGLYTEEKQCDFYISKGNIGDGWIFCNKNSSEIPSHLIKSGETYLTKLSNYIEFLSANNLALIKIDVEGSEGKAIESGIELFSKYHIPFIFLEFSPGPLVQHGTEPIKLLEIFENNGYKFAKDNFLDTNYYSKSEILERAKGGYINLFIIHSNIIKK